MGSFRFVFVLFYFIHRCFFLLTLYSLPLRSLCFTLLDSVASLLSSVFLSIFCFIFFCFYCYSDTASFRRYFRHQKPLLEIFVEFISVMLCCCYTYTHATSTQQAYDLDAVSTTCKNRTRLNEIYFSFTWSIFIFFPQYWDYVHCTSTSMSWLVYERIIWPINDNNFHI